jgi:hypothetical protein
MEMDLSPAHQAAKLSTETRAEENRPNKTVTRFNATSTENTSSTSGVQKLIFFIEDLNKITFDTRRSPSSPHLIIKIENEFKTHF